MCWLGRLLGDCSCGESKKQTEEEMARECSPFTGATVDFRGTVVDKNVVEEFAESSSPWLVLIKDHKTKLVNTLMCDTPVLYDNLKKGKSYDFIVYNDNDEMICMYRDIEDGDQ